MVWLIGRKLLCSDNQSSLIRTMIAVGDLVRSDAALACRVRYEPFEWTATDRPCRSTSPQGRRGRWGGSLPRSRGERHGSPPHPELRALIPAPTMIPPVRHPTPPPSRGGRPNRPELPSPFVGEGQGWGVSAHNSDRSPQAKRGLRAVCHLQDGSAQSRRLEGRARALQGGEPCLILGSSTSPS